MAWWGTLLGGTLGYMFGGPLGALLGAALGLAVAISRTADVVRRRPLLAPAAVVVLLVS